MRGSIMSSSSSPAQAGTSRLGSTSLARRAAIVAAPATTTTKARRRTGPAPPRGVFGDLGDAAAAASSGGISTAVVGLSALGLAGAAFVATDPERRRAAQAAEKGGDEKESVKAYFNEVGFERWSRIYSDTDDVNKVQLDIRGGHAQTVDKVLGWLDGSDLREGATICDAGCGTGSLAIPLALRGAAVTATDISAAMAGEAEKRYNDTIKAGANPPSVAPTFEAKCLEDVEGKYDTVCCIDVLIHYPQEKVDEMLGNLARRASKKIVVSFAPSTPYYEVLKRVGELFPKGAKATRAYLHKEEDVEAALRRLGWKVVRKEMTATKFYFSRLFEAVPV